MYGAPTDERFLFALFCFLFIIIYFQILGICFCGLVSPLQGGSIDKDLLDRYKGGVLQLTN
jgi:hypothetical protein